MGPLLYIVISVLLISTIFKNIKVITRYKHNKEYIECYKDLLHSEGNYYERINNYIEKENKAEFKNKGRILKLYAEIIDSKDYTNTLNELCIKDIFYDKNGVLNKDLVNYNTDSFIFIMLILAKAKKINNDELIEVITDKVLEVKGIEDRIEVKEVIALNKALLNKDDRGIALFRSLLDGSYTEYVYDKNMIGLYKKVAVSALAYLNEEFDEFYIEDLRSFVMSMIGKDFTKNLDIYDKYYVKQDDLIEEETEE